MAKLSNIFNHIIFCILFLGFWIALILVCNVGQDKPKYLKSSSMVKCAEIEYYDSLSNSLKKFYGLTRLNLHGDSVICFISNNGELIQKPQFLNSGQLSMNGDGSIADITVKGGEHYTIIVLPISNCDNTLKLDSVRKAFTDEPTYQDSEDN